MDDRDEINYLLKCLSNKERTILEKYFLEEMTLVDVGVMLGLKGTTICNSKKEAMKEIREVHNIEVSEEKIARQRNNPIQQDPLQNILPEYVADYEIDNKCAVQKDLDIIKETLLL